MTAQALPIAKSILVQDARMAARNAAEARCGSPLEAAHFDNRTCSRTIFVN